MSLAMPQSLPLNMRQNHENQLERCRVRYHFGRLSLLEISRTDTEREEN